jgi:hypothetical protein
MAKCPAAAVAAVVAKDGLRAGLRKWTKDNPDEVGKVIAGAVWSGILGGGAAFHFLRDDED